MLRGEPVQVLLALVAGSVLAVGLVGASGGTELWRVAVLPVALLLVVRALVRLVGLGLAEWYRERTAVRAYLAVVLRFVVAYLIVVAAAG
jgi:hypothetical protein